MKLITVKTGFGYFKDGAGNAIAPAQLPAGDHPLQDDLDYVEVADQAALDAVTIWQDPNQAAKQANEKKITDKIRADAIAALIATGDLPAGYK